MPFKVTEQAMFPKMSHLQWNETAQRFADYMGRFRQIVERGVAPVRFLEEATLADVGNCPVVVGVFGNDHKEAEGAEREVELIRARLKECEACELGFGLSGDGATWALLLGVESSRYQTIAGQTMQRELLKACFEEAVWGAWRQTQYEQIKLALDAVS
jgi:hypothetical protein